MIFTSHATQGNEEVKSLQLGVLTISAALKSHIDFILYLLEYIGTYIIRKSCVLDKCSVFLFLFILLVLGMLEIVGVKIHYYRVQEVDQFQGTVQLLVEGIDEESRVK